MPTIPSIPEGAKPVIVIWDDAWLSLDLDVTNAMKPCIRHTIGFLIDKDDEHVVIAWVVDGELPITPASYENPWRIPRGMVKRIVPLAPIPPKRRPRRKASEVRHETPTHLDHPGHVLRPDAD